MVAGLNCGLLTRSLVRVRDAIHNHLTIIKISHTVTWYQHHDHHHHAATN